MENLTAPSPSARLPSELLGYIFEIQNEMAWDDLEPCPTFHTSSVCKRWRDAALASPRAWTTITNLIFKKPSYKLEGPLNTLRLLLARSGEAPLYAQVIAESYMFNDEVNYFRRYIKEAVNLLQDQARRLKQLFIIYGTHDDDLLDSLVQMDTPILEVLMIKECADGTDHTIKGALAFAPLLRTLDWQGLPFTLASNPSPHLTTLNINGHVSLHPLHEKLGGFLEACPLLYSLVIDQNTSEETSLNFEPPTFHLPQLHTLAINAVNLLLFRNTTSLHALRDLRLHGCDSSAEFETMLRFRHIHLLTCLRLQYCHPTAEVMDEVFKVCGKTAVKIGAKPS